MCRYSLVQVVNGYTVGYDIECIIWEGKGGVGVEVSYNPAWCASHTHTHTHTRILVAGFRLTTPSQWRVRTHVRAHTHTYDSPLC